MLPSREGCGFCPFNCRRRRKTNVPCRGDSYCTNSLSRRYASFATPITDIRCSPVSTRVGVNGSTAMASCCPLFLELPDRRDEMARAATPGKEMQAFSLSSTTALSRLCRLLFLAAAMCNEVLAISQGDTCTLISEKTRRLFLKVCHIRQKGYLFGRQQAPRTMKTIFSKVEQIFERRTVVLVGFWEV